MRVACIMFLFTLLLQGCGHKGALFLPPAQPAHPAAHFSAQQVPQPAPAK